MPRRAKQGVSYSADDAWYPGTASQNPLFAHIEQLNRESFPFFLYSLADDLLVRALFSPKREDPRWNGVVPDRASKYADLSSTLVWQDIRRAAALCHPLTNGPITESVQEAVSRVASSLLDIPTFSRSEVQWLDVLTHLLFRYALMYQSTSPVRHCKVQFGHSMAFGLRARIDLQPGTFIMETCSSMSSDIVPGSGPSIIEGQAKQRGPQGPRVILGPFRFANHNCKANARIYAISHTSAYVLVVEIPISAGEEVTVKYAKDGYYRHGCLCFACTEQNPTQIRNPKRPRESGDGAGGSGVLSHDSVRPKKKVRRGLKGKKRTEKTW